DGLAYWPLSEEEFFGELHTDWDTELNRYHWVIQLDSACQYGYDSSNPIRSESPEEALKINQRLHQIWSRHPRYFRIPSHFQFIKKIRFAEFLIHQILRGHSLETIKGHLARFLNS
ncbi:MAG: hypothetical protein NZ480_05395, partial [Bdellovibrionaceae bacterium]|nr:hypothetical protein [Pseudobdellovibrionaceae bacterium]